ncbi:hypothetical protein F4825DRAFT_377612 [Nemania diffusa]|nr:hypothetical protein F4825DRAFT_377612 [Nemania diffusa]
MAEVAPARLIGPGDESVRKSSKHRDGATSKKRHRDSNQTEKHERKRKKSRREVLPAELIEVDEAPKQKQKSHKSSKTTEDEATTTTADAEENGGDDSVKRVERKRKHRKEPKESKKSKKKKKSKESHDDDLDDDIFEYPNVVVLASSRSKKRPGATLSSKHQYPFYTQTVSQYLPLHPLGINEPLQGYMNQHLEPLLNRYVPSFGGVLLAYRNPRIGEAPGSGSLTQDSGMDDIVVLESINEHAVNYGWLTVEIDIFRPSRGAWLEGLVNIQSEGHIGVVCWSKFNASIESERLPRDWQWVDQHKDETTPATPASETAPEDSPEAAQEQEPTEVVHATGYWVDGAGAKVTSDTPICFRIKNYEVGSSGDYGYLSIEGTMLSLEDEEKKVHREIEVRKRKLKQGSVLRRERRPLSELGITKFGDNDERERESPRTEV